VHKADFIYLFIIKLLQKILNNIKDCILLRELDSAAPPLSQ